MPLQDLDKFILHKTVIGIICPSCGGDLQIVQRAGREFLRRIFPFVSRRVFNYRCNSCGHRFKMSRQ